MKPACSLTCQATSYCAVGLARRLFRPPPPSRPARSSRAGPPGGRCWNALHRDGASPPLPPSQFSGPNNLGGSFSTPMASARPAISSTAYVSSIAYILKFVKSPPRNYSPPRETSGTHLANYGIIKKYYATRKINEGAISPTIKYKAKAKCYQTP